VGYITYNFNHQVKFKTDMNLENLVRQLAYPKLYQLFAPEKLANISVNLPQKLHQMVFGKLLNLAFKTQVIDGDFAFLAGRRLQIEIIDANLFIGITYRNHQLHCEYFAARPREADATLSVASVHAIKLLQQQIDPDTLFFQRKLKISGDTELAHQVKNTIDALAPETIPGLVRRILSEYQQLLSYA
jgi:O2-independent ubiquinone biosynthesis accessory factor UbiT